MSEFIGLYIHIPFCKSKCPYCDFFSGKATEKEYDEYIAHLIDKIEYWSKQTKKQVASVYFGGGTPSVLGAERLCLLLEKIKCCFSLTQNAEITAEVNPDTGKNIDFEWMRKSGFNRISVGLQSADEREIQLLGRIHSIDDAKETVKRAREAGINNISLDLMMGIPFQTIESLQKSIDFCHECGVEHISSYILKIEEGTDFYSKKNQLPLPDEDAQAELYLFAVGYLQSLGYEQYEISNFAKKGFESRHNSSYWKCCEYIGIGPSAHSFFNGKRFYYGRNMRDFIQNKMIDDGMGGDEGEFMMLALRLKQGLVFSEYEKKYQKPFPFEVLKKMEGYARLGFMEVNHNSACFTPKGFLVSNTIISNLI